MCEREGGTAGDVSLSKEERSVGSDVNSVHYDMSTLPYFQPYLHITDVLSVPDGLEDQVGKTQHRQVLNQLLAYF